MLAAMRTAPRRRARLALALSTALLGATAVRIAAPAAKPAPPPPALPSEIPATFTPRTAGFDYEKRTAMIPMRDGTKLFTVIVVPKGAKRAPMLMTRTPYDAAGYANRSRARTSGRSSRTPPT
jgi:predicted acyl esterase